MTINQQKQQIVIAAISLQISWDLVLTFWGFPQSIAPEVAQSNACAIFGVEDFQQLPDNIKDLFSRVQYNRESLLQELKYCDVVGEAMYLLDKRLGTLRSEKPFIFPLEVQFVREKGELSAALGISDARNNEIEKLLNDLIQSGCNMLRLIEIAATFIGNHTNEWTAVMFYIGVYWSKSQQKTR